MITTLATTVATWNDHVDICWTILAEYKVNRGSPEKISCLIFFYLKGGNIAAIYVTISMLAIFTLLLIQSSSSNLGSS
jgi:hypothetical protein